jgi:hypothetical protein
MDMGCFCLLNSVNNVDVNIGIEIFVGVSIDISFSSGTNSRVVNIENIMEEEKYERRNNEENYQKIKEEKFCTQMYKWKNKTC